MDQSSFLLFRDAAASADCSWPHHILGKSLAFHLELRFSSSCRGELRTRWPPAQKGPGNCWGPSSPGRGTPSRAPSTWRPDYGLTSTPWPLNVPSSALLKYPSPPLYPPGTSRLVSRCLCPGEADVPAPCPKCTLDSSHRARQPGRSIVCWAPGCLPARILREGRNASAEPIRGGRTFEEMTPGDQVSPLTSCPQPHKCNTFTVSTFVSPGPTSDSHLAQVPEGCACRLEFALVQKQMGLSPPDGFPPIAVTHRPGDRRLPKCAASRSLCFRANVWVCFNNRRVLAGLGRQFGRVVGDSGPGIGLPVPRPRQVASCCTSVSSSVKWEDLIVCTCLVGVSST